MAGRNSVLLVVVGVVLFGAGIAVGAYAFGGAGDTPCWQVQENLQDARGTLAETFGDNEEGQAALDEIAAVAQDNPDCFSPADRDSIARMAEIEPSGSGTDEAVPATVSESVSEP